QPPEITGATVNGASVGTPEEIFVWDLVRQLGRRDRWCTEIDVVADIGFPNPKAPGPAPKGEVTVTIDAKGNASARLINKGTPVSPPGPFTSIDDAKKKLLGDFAISKVTDGDANWTLEELNKVFVSFQRINANDRAALAHVELIRNHVVTDAN